mmetsp:Transcript_57333/g.159564  ORF Transcript_57333/g.159564 Transcript_57333/m.159564 type:complete len:205 (+) Transcript_57333:1287-1901(+)
MPITVDTGKKREHAKFWPHGRQHREVHVRDFQRHLCVNHLHPGLWRVCGDLRPGAHALWPWTGAYALWRRKQAPANARCKRGHWTDGGLQQQARANRGPRRCLDWLKLWRSVHAWAQQARTRVQRTMWRRWAWPHWPRGHSLCHWPQAWPGRPLRWDARTAHAPKRLCAGMYRHAALPRHGQVPHAWQLQLLLFRPVKHCEARS